MFDNTNPYSLRKEVVGGLTYYYVSFIDAQGALQETKISRQVYLEFARFVKRERNLRRSDERHIEQSELTENMLNNRAKITLPSTEETAIENMRDAFIQKAIAALPEIQRRRFTLYYESEYTYEQIAEMEGCTKRAIKFSVDRAKEKIIEEIKNK